MEKIVNEVQDTAPVELAPNAKSDDAEVKEDKTEHVEE